MKKNNSKKDEAKNKWDLLIPIIISIISLIFSVKSNFDNRKLEEKYNILSTYGMTLSYQIDIGNETANSSFKFGDITLNNGQIDIIPKMGGIEKVYAVHYYQDNVKAILPVDLYCQEAMEKHDAQAMAFRLDEYTIDNIASDNNSFYGTLFLVIKDYQNNYYTNMIIYEINKQDTSQFQTRVYDEIDLLHLYNEDINVLPEFDLNQMEDFKCLRDKVKQILK